MSQSADSWSWLYYMYIWETFIKIWIKIEIKFIFSFPVRWCWEKKAVILEQTWIISRNILWGWCWDSNFMNTISDRISSLSPYLNKSLPASAARRGQVCLWSPGLGVYVIVVIRIIFTPDEIMFILETKFVAFRFGYWNSVTYSRFNKNISDPRD